MVSTLTTPPEVILTPLTEGLIVYDAASITHPPLLVLARALKVVED